jgi:hypothetical protein
MRSVHNLAIAAAFAIALAVTSTTLAQTTAPAAPTVTPAPNCEKPGEPPSLSAPELGKAAAEMKRNNWSKNMKAYLDCLKIFISDQQAAAQPHIKAANAAVDEFNKSIKVFNDQIEAQKQ